jgi:hypothetical protein
MGFRVETDPTGVQDTGKRHLLWAHLIEVKVVFCQRFVRHFTFTPPITQLPAFHPLCVFTGSLQLPSVIHLIQQTDMGDHAIIASYPLQVCALLQNEVDMCAPFCIGVESGAILNDCRGWARGNDVPDGYKLSLIGWVFPGAGQLTWFHVFLLHSRAGGSERPVHSILNATSMSQTRSAPNQDLCQTPALITRYNSRVFVPRHAHTPLHLFLSDGRYALLDGCDALIDVQMRVDSGKVFPSSLSVFGEKTQPH